MDNPEEVLDCNQPTRVNQEFTRTLWKVLLNLACSGVSRWGLKSDHTILAGAPNGIQNNLKEELGISRPVPARVIVNAKPVYAQLFTEAEGLYLQIGGYSDLLTTLCGLEQSLWDDRIAAFWASYAAKNKREKNRRAKIKKADLAKAIKSAETNNRRPVLPDPRDPSFIPPLRLKSKNVLPGNKRPSRSFDQPGPSGLQPSVRPKGGSHKAKKARLSVSSSDSVEALSESSKSYAEVTQQRNEWLDKKPLGEYGVYVTGPNKGPLDEQDFKLVRQVLAMKEFERRNADPTYIWCNVVTRSFGSGRGRIVLNDPESVEIVRRRIPEILAEINRPMEVYSSIEYDQRVVLKVRFADDWDLVEDKLRIVVNTLSLHQAPCLKELCLRRVINMSGKHRGKIGFVAMHTDTARLVIQYGGNFGGPGAQICFWDGNGKPVNQGPLLDLIEQIKCYKLIADLEAQAMSDVSDNHEDKNLSTNWDNGILSDLSEDVHLNEIHIDPETEFPLGRDCNQWVAGPTVNSGTKAIAMVPEPSAPNSEAIATEMEPSAQTLEATASTSEATASNTGPSALSDLFGPPFGEDNVNKSFDVDAFLDSPAFANVNPTLGSKGEIPQEETPGYESEDEQNILDLTLTETSADNALAVKDRPKEVVANCEEEMSTDNSDLPHVEEDQMEISPESVITS